MSDTTTINADGDDVAIKLAGLTVICHQGELNVKPADPRLFNIDAEDTLACARTLSQDEWTLIAAEGTFLSLWSLVWVDVRPPPVLAESNTAMRHVVGLILLSVQALVEGRIPFVRLPETYLHPRQQTGLADLFNALRTGNAGKREGATA